MGDTQSCNGELAESDESEGKLSDTDDPTGELSDRDHTACGDRFTIGTVSERDVEERPSRERVGTSIGITPTLPSVLFGIRRATVGTGLCLGRHRVVAISTAREMGGCGDDRVSFVYVRCNRWMAGELRVIHGCGRGGACCDALHADMVDFCGVA